MAAKVYYKFKCEKEINKSISILGNFITVGDLKEKIFEANKFRRIDYPIVINPQTNQEYVDETTLIPKFPSVVIRRIPRYCLYTHCRKQQVVVVENNNHDEIDSKTKFQQPTKHVYDGIDFDDFGEDVFAIPQSNSIDPVTDLDEESKIQALVNTPALDSRINFSGFERLKPHEGYVCHRCNIPGHFIQHCPTNGDPNFDIKSFKPATDIQKSTLVDDSCGVPKLNVSAAENGTLNITKLPPELYCPLCKQVMKEAVFTKCCFRSFCDNCIKKQIISKTKCICGATGRLADGFVPNNTLRDTIRRILETNISSAVNCDQASKEGEPTKTLSTVTTEEALKNIVPDDKNVQHKQLTVEPAKKKKKMEVNNVHMSEEEMKWGYMTPSGPFRYNPYGMEASYINPYIRVKKPRQIPTHRESSEDRESRRKVGNNVDDTSMKLKSISTSPPLQQKDHDQQNKQVRHGDKKHCRVIDDYESSDDEKRHSKRRRSHSSSSVKDNRLRHK